MHGTSTATRPLDNPTKADAAACAAGLTVSVRAKLTDVRSTLEESRLTLANTLGSIRGHEAGPAPSVGHTTINESRMPTIDAMLEDIRDLAEACRCMSNELRDRIGD